MFEAIADPRALPNVTARVRATLHLMRRRGYVPTVETLAANLIGGGVPPEDLIAAVDACRDVRAEGDFVYLLGDESLLEASKERVEGDRRRSSQTKW